MNQGSVWNQESAIKISAIFSVRPCGQNWKSPITQVLKIDFKPLNDEKTEG
jgi:hypothetical protein